MNKAMLRKIFISTSLIFVVCSVYWGFSSPQSGSINVSVDTNKEFQEIEGFGGFLPMLRWWLSWDNYSNEAKNKLFDTIVDYLGCSVIRLPFPAGCEIENDNADPFSLDMSKFDVTRRISRDGETAKYDAEVNVGLAGLEEVRKRGITRFIMSSYSVARWLKDSGNLNGGSIRTDMFDEFAETFVGTARAYKDDLNLEVYCMSLFNEPNLEKDYATTKASPETVSDLVIRTKQRMQSEGLNTKVGAPEHNKPELYLGSEPWISTQAGNFLDAFVFHQYGDFFNPFASIYTGGLPDIKDFAGGLNVPIIQNEISNHRESARADTHEEAMNTAMHVHQALVVANANIWNWWALYDITPPDNSSIAGQRLIYLDPDNGDIWLSPKAYALRQYFKFIPPGSRRVEITDAPDVLLSAFLLPDNDISIVAINDTAEPRDIQMTIQGRTYAQLNKVEYSENQRSHNFGKINGSGSSFSSTLAPSSVTTFTSLDLGADPVTDSIPPNPPTGVKVNGGSQ